MTNNKSALKGRAARRLMAGASFSLLFGAVAAVNAQNFEPPAITPLGDVGIPDVNAMGLLDKTGPGADAWTFEAITKPQQQQALQALGKALYWDMQVGSDGVQACASCHFHAGADNRVQHQLSPHGPKALNNRGIDIELAAVNVPLETVDFSDPDGTGLPANEVVITNAGSTPDDLLTGVPGAQGAGDVSGIDDVNDVVGSQGVTVGEFLGLSGDAIELHSGGTGLRQVTERNTPSAINAIYNLRNFWDGRAEAFFNGVNPHGFQDQDAAVRIWTGEALASETLRIPFSSLASQAVGPIGSAVEMIFAGRSAQDLGKKMLNPALVPLAGQQVACDDSLLGDYADCDADFQRGLAGANYGDLIDQIFDDRFTAADVCVDVAGEAVACEITVTDAGFCGTDELGAALSCDVANPDAYSLKEYNFALFFGLAVQAYEATLTTPDTIVDLINGGIATGTVTNDARRNKTVSVEVTGMPLEACVAAMTTRNQADAVLIAEQLCTRHYSQFIHPRAVAGQEVGGATGLFIAPLVQLSEGDAIGGCGRYVEDTNTGNMNAGACANHHVINAWSAMAAIDRGQGRFFAGAPLDGANEPNLPSNFVERDAQQLAAIGDELLAPGAPGDMSTGLWIPTAPNDLTPRQFPFTVSCAPNAEFAGGGRRNQRQTANACDPAVTPDERIGVFGAFKTPNLRNVKFTGPYFHNGSAMNLRQVFEFYKQGGNFPNINFNNIADRLGPFALNPEDESSTIEFMETGLTDWNLAYRLGVPRADQV